VADANKNLIVVFASYKYSRILKNWLVAIEKLGSLPVLVVSLDERLADELRSQGIPTIFSPCDAESGSAIWSARAKVIYELVAAGYNVIHSDADAVWLKDARDLLKESKADVVISQGTTYPLSCHEAWGHLLCYGFVQFRTTAATKEMLRILAEQADGPEPFDDQHNLNQYLLVNKIKWNVSSPYSVPFRNREFQCSFDAITGEAEPDTALSLRVTILPHSKVQRLPEVESPGDCYVCHPVSPKTPEGTEAALRVHNCWFLTR
jgi:hypothetical protein